MMPEINLEFIVGRLDAIQTEQREIRAQIADIAADLKVLTGIVLRLARDMELVKDHLGRMDARISVIERA